MARENVYNFAAGPSVMPLPALEQARAELLDYAVRHGDEPSQQAVPGDI